MLGSKAWERHEFRQGEFDTGTQTFRNIQDPWSRSCHSSSRSGVFRGPLGFFFAGYAPKPGRT